MIIASTHAHIVSRTKCIILSWRPAWFVVESHSYYAAISRYEFHSTHYVFEFPFSLIEIFCFYLHSNKFSVYVFFLSMMSINNPGYNQLFENRSPWNHLKTCVDVSLTCLRFDWRSLKSRSSAARRSRRSFCWFFNPSNSSRLSFCRWKKKKKKYDVEIATHEEKKKKAKTVVFVLRGLQLMHVIVHGDCLVFLVVLTNPRGYSMVYRNFHGIMTIDWVPRSNKRRNTLDKDQAKEYFRYSRLEWRELD